jgi:hypothetical protein
MNPGCNWVRAIQRRMWVDGKARASLFFNRMLSGTSEFQKSNLSFAVLKPVPKVPVKLLPLHHRFNTL